MATQTLAIILVLIAAAIEALSNVLQHKAANSTGHVAGASEAGAVLRTLRKPLFLVGFLLMVVGYGFHIASLGLGNLAVIQVIFVTQLVFILPFSRIVSGTQIAHRDWLGAVVVTVGIAFFVSFSRPTEGASNATGGRWLLAVGGISLLCLIVIVAGYKMSGPARAALIGCAGGLMNGLVAPLTKGTIDVAAGGIATLFSQWFIYVTLIAALLGVLFPLMAFRAGPITASFPAVMSLNPIVATLLGVYLFGEVLQGGAFNIFMMSVSAVVIFVGIIWLSRSKAIAQAFEDHGDGKPEASATATLL